LEALLLPLVRDLPGAGGEARRREKDSRCSHARYRDPLPNAVRPSADWLHEPHPPEPTQDLDFHIPGYIVTSRFRILRDCAEATLLHRNSWLERTSRQLPAIEQSEVRATVAVKVKRPTAAASVAIHVATLVAGAAHRWRRHLGARVKLGRLGEMLKRQRVVARNDQVSAADESKLGAKLSLLPVVF
jgi:hypothetical protein